MCSCKKKAWVVFLIILSWIITTTILLVPVSLILLKTIKTQSKQREYLLVLYGTLLATNILQCVMVFYALYGVVMEKDYIKLRIAVAVSLDIVMIVYTALLLAIAEHVAYVALLIAIPVLLLMFYAIKCFYKNLLGDDF